jgi:hypothetical protein
VAIVLYPKANWLFAFVLIGIALVVFQVATSKGPSPQEIASQAERLLSGTGARWDVDDYEHLNPKDSALNDLWRTTMTIGGLPETWTRLDEQRKSELQEIIAKLRNMESRSQ